MLTTATASDKTDNCTNIEGFVAQKADIEVTATEVDAWDVLECKPD